MLIVLFEPLSARRNNKLHAPFMVSSIAKGNHQAYNPIPNSAYENASQSARALIRRLLINSRESHYPHLLQVPALSQKFSHVCKFDPIPDHRQVKPLLLQISSAKTLCYATKTNARRCKGNLSFLVAYQNSNSSTDKPTLPSQTQDEDNRS